MNNAVKMAVGLAGLAVTVYVAGWAWKKSQDKSLNAAGAAGAKCRCKGTIMPCKFCAAGTPL